MTVFYAAVGTVIFVGLVILARQQYRRGLRLSELLFEPSGIRMRIWLWVSAGTGMQVARGSTAWPYVTGVWFGLVAWEVTVQAAAWIRRVRRRQAPRAS
jgi:hypothetical protein